MDSSGSEATLVLELLRANNAPYQAPMTIAEIGGALGINLVTVLAILLEFEQRGWVQRQEVGWRVTASK